MNSARTIAVLEKIIAQLTAIKERLAAADAKAGTSPTPATKSTAKKSIAKAPAKKRAAKKTVQLGGYGRVAA